MPVSWEEQVEQMWLWKGACFDKLLTNTWDMKEKNLWSGSCARVYHRLTWLPLDLLQYLEERRRADDKTSFVLTFMRGGQWNGISCYSSWSVLLSPHLGHWETC